MDFGRKRLKHKLEVNIHVMFVPVIHFVFAVI